MFVECTVRHLGFLGDGIKIPMRIFPHKLHGIVETTILNVLGESTPGKFLEQYGEFVDGYPKFSNQIFSGKVRIQEKLTGNYLMIHSYKQGLVSVSKDVLNFPGGGSRSYGFSLGRIRTIIVFSLSPELGSELYNLFLTFKKLVLVAH